MKLKSGPAGANAQDCGLAQTRPEKGAAMTERWIDRFAGLSRLSPSVQDMLRSKSTIISLPKGTVIFGPGKTPDTLLLLLEGVVQVRQISEGGREIVLYRVNAGESCVLTSACMLAYQDHSAEGLAETDVRAVAIPRGVFDDLVTQSLEFRSFVFSAYSRRITELFQVIENIAFQRLDIRLAHKLEEMAQGRATIHATHQQLAIELGTAREVISRQLQEFQRRAWIAQSRGAIEILQPAELARLAQSEAA